MLKGCMIVLIQINKKGFKMIRNSKSLKIFLTFFFILIFSACQKNVAPSAKNDMEMKTALVVGIADYNEATPLKNPINDATDFSKTLKKIGFDVITVLNPTKEEFDQSINLFIKKLNDNGGIGLFYYAGHGSQLGDKNYLIPADFSVNTTKSIDEQAINSLRILEKMGNSKSSVNILILDACRDNPFEDSFKVASRALKIKKGHVGSNTGLTKIHAPKNAFIAFSTSPGEVAVDGDGRNSPYVKQLMKSIQKENYTIEQVFQDVRNSVYNETNGKQIPWENSSLLHSHYFKPIKRIPTGW